MLLFNKPSLVFIAAVLATLTDFGAGICPYKACSCKGDLIDCAGRNLRAIPAVNPQYKGGNYTTLDFSRNRILKLENNKIIPNLERIDFRGNKIQGVSVKAFGNLGDTLKEVRFQSTYLRNVPLALDDLKVVEVLEISNVNVSDWHPKVMEHLGATIKEVDFTRTSLQRWPQWLKYMVFLQKLTLSTNPLESIPRYAFTEWRHQLQSLDLSSTKISSANFLSELSALTYLNLANNELSNDVFLSYNLFPSSQTLVELNLRFNHLSTVPRLISFTKLENLNLQGNTLSLSDSNSFPPSLQVLNLGLNHFTQIPQGINKLTNLVDLDLHRNDIESVRGIQLSGNFNKLENLNLASNPIGYIHMQAFRDLTNLKTLDLSSTYLRKLPIALNTLHSLTELRMKRLNDLLCTCHEKSVSDWYKSKQPNLNIVGTCGNKPLSSFVEKIPSGCSE